MVLTQIIEFLKNTDELDTAKTLLDTFKKYAKSIDQFDELGMLYQNIKQYGCSKEMLYKCLELANEDQKYAVYFNLTKVLNYLNEPDLSLYYHDLISKKYPISPDQRLEESLSYFMKGDYDRSSQIQIDLLKLPDLDDELKKKIRFNLGSYEIMRGNFKKGLKDSIIGGKEIGLWKSKSRPFEKWDGQFTKKTILVYAEAGIGDEIIDIRFTKEIENRGMKYIWVGHRDFTNKIFSSNGYNTITAEEADKLIINAQDYAWCESMALPVLLDLEEPDLWNGPYLKPKPEYIDKWKEKLPEKFITVRWSGNPFYEHDLHRTIPREELMDVVKGAGLPLVSLQIEEKHNDLINPEICDWDDTIAIQSLAVLNVTSCTSTAHSASAIDSKCVVMPPLSIYHTWMNLKDDDSSHWYSSNTKVFPQTKHKDWSEPLSKLKEMLCLTSTI